MTEVTFELHFGGLREEVERGFVSGRRAGAGKDGEPEATLGGRAPWVPEGSLNTRQDWRGRLELDP